MLRHRRDACIEEIIWKTKTSIDAKACFDQGEIPEHVRTLECWCYEGVPDSEQHRYVRLLNICDTGHYLRERSEWLDEFNAKIEKWLDGKDEYTIPKPSTASMLQGGFRLLMCERREMRPCMTLTRDAFEMIESQFHLHETTLPALSDHGGSFMFHALKDEHHQTREIQMVVKVRHMLDVANCLIALTFNVESNWTDALICGDGVVRERWNDNIYGMLAKQIITPLTQAALARQTDPMLLPMTILHVCMERMQTRAHVLERKLTRMETHLGVTFTGQAGDYERTDTEWPLGIDVKWATRELHSLLPRILFMNGQGSWLVRYSKWLLDVESELTNRQAAQASRYVRNELESVLKQSISRLDGMAEFYEGMRGRTQSQIDLLFNIIGQRDSLISREANDVNLEVARATKEDSISMSTFTFITALFLPPSFVATLFSMSMFDWSNDGTNGGVTSTLSSKFWIFWVVAIPLTAVTIGGWYVWYLHADRKWQRRLRETLEKTDDKADHKITNNGGRGDRPPWHTDPPQRWRATPR